MTLNCFVKYANRRRSTKHLQMHYARVVNTSLEHLRTAGRAIIRRHICGLTMKYDALCAKTCLSVESDQRRVRSVEISFCETRPHNCVSTCGSRTRFSSVYFENARMGRRDESQVKSITQLSESRVAAIRSRDALGASKLFHYSVVNICRLGPKRSALMSVI